MSDSRLKAWAYLSRTVEGPSRALQQLLAAGRDVEEIAHGVRQRENWIGGLLAETVTRHQVNRAEEDLESIKRVGGRLITPDSEEWPREEFALAFGFAASAVTEHARSLQEDAVPPHALWVKGGNVRQLVAQSVSVVGTRAMSQYGKEATRQLVAGLAQHRWTIISGGALGIDAEAHRTALSSGGQTVAVAACGLDKNYPAAHSELFGQIAESGALISEYPPGISPARHRFLTRNRLVAALAQGTVIVEAAWRSGALNTLTWAEGLGRVPMAVPGPITGVSSLGCHDRIRNGRAQLVVSADEIRELVSAIGEVDTEGQYEMLFAANAVQGLSRNEMRVFDAMSQTPTNAETISSESGLSLPLTVHLLVDLQKRALVRREGAQWCRADGH